MTPGEEELLDSFKALAAEPIEDAPPCPSPQVSPPPRRSTAPKGWEGTRSCHGRTVGPLRLYVERHVFQEDEVWSWECHSTCGVVSAGCVAPTGNAARKASLAYVKRLALEILTGL